MIYSRFVCPSRQEFLNCTQTLRESIRSRYFVVISDQRRLPFGWVKRFRAYRGLSAQVTALIDEAIISVLIFDVSVNGLGHDVIAKVYKIVERLTEHLLCFLVRFSKHAFRVDDVLFWWFDWTKAMDVTVTYNTAIHKGVSATRHIEYILKNRQASSIVQIVLCSYGKTTIQILP